MLAALLIVLREVVEAALVIGIVMAATQGVAGRSRWVIAGIAAGVIGALVIAGFAQTIADALSGVGTEFFNASVLMLACIMLGWHNVWMKSHGRELSQHMKQTGASVASGARPLSVLLIVVGLAVLREGSEVVLFLYGLMAGGAQSFALLSGSFIGLLGGVVIGAAMYFGLVLIPMRQLFNVTGWMLLLLAAGMAAQSAGFLVQAGFLPGLMEPVWDSSWLLSEGSILGKALQALIGYDDQPSGMQLVFWAVAFTTILLLMRRVDRRLARNAPTNRGTGSPAAARG
jgi:high-affinity iron transporter